MSWTDRQRTASRGARGARPVRVRDRWLHRLTTLSLLGIATLAGCQRESSTSGAEDYSAEQAASWIAARAPYLREGGETRPRYWMLRSLSAAGTRHRHALGLSHTLVSKTDSPLGDWCKVKVFIPSLAQGGAHAVRAVVRATDGTAIRLETASQGLLFAKKHVEPLRGQPAIEVDDLNSPTGCDSTFGYYTFSVFGIRCSEVGQVDLSDALLTWQPCDVQLQLRAEYLRENPLPSAPY